MTAISVSVSIIIVNWNGKEFLENCFCSLREQSFKDFEVVFVDNASSDSSVEKARELSSELALPVKIMRLSENSGFTGGNIEGLKHCSGKYIALLNNDTFASKGWLQALVSSMESHPEVGICASKLIVMGSDIIDSAGDGYSTFGRAFKRGDGLPASFYNEKEYVFGACGGAALYRRNMIDEIGFLDNDFFLFFEDADLNFRAQLAGWKCLYIPDAVVHHKVGGSAGKVSGLAAYYGVRNDKIVKVKNLPLAIVLLHLPGLILNELILLLYNLRMAQLRSYIRGNCEFLKNLPYYLRKRKQVMRLVKISPMHINSILTSGLFVYTQRHFYRMKTAFQKKNY